MHIHRKLVQLTNHSPVAESYDKEYITTPTRDSTHSTTHVPNITTTIAIWTSTGYSSYATASSSPYPYH